MAMKRAAFIVSVLVFMSVFHIMLTILPENARANTLFVGGSGPGNYTTIQEAVNDANPSDTVYVYKGTYYESVTVPKALNLIGEDRNMTVINGSGFGDVVRVNASWVNITGFNITFGYSGISLESARNCIVANNTVWNTFEGILLEYSDNIALIGNTVFSNRWGDIVLYYSNNNIITENSIHSSSGDGISLLLSRGNTITNNSMVENGIHISGDALEHWNTHFINSSNTVNGKPVYYWKNAIGGVIPPSAGQVIVVNSTSVAVMDQIVSNGSVGVQLVFSRNCTISNVNASGNFHDGIRIYNSHNNTVVNNSAWSNRLWSGIYFSYSDNNNITNNTVSLNGGDGIRLSNSNGNAILDNTVMRNYGGISLYSSGNTTLVNNVMIEGGIQIFGDTLEHWNTHIIDTSNTVNGKPVYYWKNVTGGTIPLDAGQAIIANATGVVVENLTLRNTSAGIELGFSSHITISHVNAARNVVGIFLTYSDNSSIARSNASNNNYGIYLWSHSNDNAILDNMASNNTIGIFIRDYSNNNTIFNNTASNNRYGIYISASDHNTMVNNTVLSNNQDGILVAASDNNSIAGSDVSSNGRYGIEVLVSTNTTVSRNFVTSNGQSGINLDFSNGNNTISGNVISDNSIGILLWYSDNNTIDSNRASSNTGTGIELDDSCNNTVSNNTVNGNPYGIYLVSSHNNAIIRNDVLMNAIRGISLRISGQNGIYHNSIMSNTLQAFDDNASNQWDNGYPSGGNYWSDYTGFDRYSGPDQDRLGSDGLGDTPYVIDLDSMDRYPLASPFPPLAPMPPFPVNAILTGMDLENVTLTWTLSPDDGQRLKSVVHYDIYRNTSYHSEGLSYQFLGSVPNGTSQFVDVQAGEGDMNNYFYRICAVDFNNTTRCSGEQLGKFTVSLGGGPNPISIPLIQPDESLQTVLQTVSYDNAWSFDPINQEWKSFMKSKPYAGTLEYVNHTMGFWVNVTEDSNLTVAGVVPTVTIMHLQAGWNLVGFPSFDDNYTVADLKAAVAVERIEGFDAPASPYFLRVLTDGDFLQAGFGYWIRVGFETSWTVSNS